ncbi:MAG: hypothetical protein ACPGVO_11265 [Spirulinaceae cyanobacterium]
MNFRINIKIGSLAVIALCTLGLSGCLVFEQLPFPDSELKNFSETVLADELLAIAQQDLPEEARQILEDDFQDEPDPLIYTVSENLVLSFVQHELGWTSQVFMKNDSHFMACELMVGDELEAPEGITLTQPAEEEIPDSTEGILKQLAKEGVDAIEPEELDSTDLFPPTIVSGTKEAMRDFILELSSSSPKICLAIPMNAIGDPIPDSE